jgi:hypothetical protein
MFLSNLGGPTLRAVSPTIAALVADGQMKVIASCYDLASGKLKMLG